MRIAISGTYSTGKTTTALALSVLSGISVTHARTMREILPQCFPGKRLEKCTFSELMELGMRRFNERIIAEIQCNGSFVSDGCSLQEWLYGSTRMITGLNPTENASKLLAHKHRFSNEWDVFSMTINSFGDVVKDYAKRQYDKIVHLPVEFPFVADGHRPTSEAFRVKSEEILLDTYKEIGLEIISVTGSLNERLEQICHQLNIPVKMSIEEAIKIANDIRSVKFDSVEFEHH